MFKLVLMNLARRPLRVFLTTAGIASAVAVLLLIDQIAGSYRAQLFRELNLMGMHLMLVPLGCPYEAASRVLKGNTLETSLPDTAVAEARNNPAVEIAAPLLIAAVARLEQGRTDMFVGMDESGMSLRSWWKPESGEAKFTSEDSVILGSDAAQIEMRQPGDRLYSPETKRTFTVAGVLTRSGTSDDSLLFVPLRTAQTMFNSAGRVTAVAIRLRDPVQLEAVSAQLQQIPGVQVVTQTEMMGTFLNILGSVRTLLQSIGIVAAVGSIAALINTLLMSVAERKFEFSLFRALGASQLQLFTVIVTESVLLTAAGVVGGVMVCLLFGGVGMSKLGTYLPYGGEVPFQNQAITILFAFLIGSAIAVIASVFPAIRAMRIEPAYVLKGGE